MKRKCSMVSEPIASPKGSRIAGRTMPSTIGRMKIKAAPKKEPIRLPSPPMMTMNRMKKDWLMSKTLYSAPPYQKNTIMAPATPQ